MHVPPLPVRYTGTLPTGPLTYDRPPPPDRNHADTQQIVLRRQRGGLQTRIGCFVWGTSGRVIKGSYPGLAYTAPPTHHRTAMCTVTKSQSQGTWGFWVRPGG